MMPIRSISAALACPTALSSAQRRIRGTSRWRACGVSSLESATPSGAGLVSGASSTTPTETGPASAPRPTSSTAASRPAPVRHASRS